MAEECSIAGDSCRCGKVRGEEGIKRRRRRRLSPVTLGAGQFETVVIRLHGPAPTDRDMVAPYGAGRRGDGLSSWEDSCDRVGKNGGKAGVVMVKKVE